MDLQSLDTYNNNSFICNINVIKKKNKLSTTFFKKKFLNKQLI